jgi:hypothetical protein
MVSFTAGNMFLERTSVKSLLNRFVVSSAEFGDPFGEFIDQSVGGADDHPEGV